MKCKIIIALLSLLLPAITHCKAQTIYDQNRILRLQSLYNLAEKCFQESQYDLCEEYLTEYSSLFTEINDTTSGLVSGAWMYAPCVMMGYIEEERGNIDSAIILYELVCKLSYQYAQILYDNGIINENGYISGWCALRDLYLKKQRYNDALELSRTIVTFCRQYLPDKLAIQLSNIANIYLDIKDYIRATDCFSEAIQLLVSKEETKENIDLFYSDINGLFSSYYFSCRYQEVLACKDKYRDFINAGTEHHQDEIYLLNNIIAKCYYQLDLFEKAFQTTVTLTSFAYHKYGEYSIEHANQVNNLAQLYVAYYNANNNAEHLQLARQQYEYANKIWNHIPRKEEFDDYATFLNNYGLLYASQNEYKKAAGFYSKALSLHQKKSSIDATITASINLGTALLNLQRPKAAEAVYRQALNLSDTDSIRYATHRMNIYRLLSSLHLTAYQDIQGAEELANCAFQIAQTSANNVDKINVFHALAQIYETIGNGLQSFNLHYQAIKIKLDLNLPIAPHEWLFLAESASHHQEGTDDPYSGTIVACQSALAGLHENDELKAKALDLLGYAYTQRGEYEKAKPLIHEAMQIRKKLCGSHSQSYESSLSTLVVFHSLIGDYQTAERYALEAVSINKDMTNLNNLVMINYMALNQIGIERYLPDFYTQAIAEIKSLFIFLDERQRSDFVDSEKQTLNNLASIAYKFSNSSICLQYAYNAELATKGLLLNTTSQIRRIVENSNNSKLEQHYNRLLNLQHDLSNEKDSVQYLRLTYLISQAEKNLQKMISSEDKEFTSDINLTWKNIQSQLSTNSVAIEFVEFYRDLAEEDDILLYAALVLRKDWDSPQMIPLCSKEELEQISRINLEDEKWRKNSFARKDLDKRYFKKGYSLIWSKLEPYINEGDNVYFSPSGLLHQINMEVLKDSIGRQANEKYNLYRVSSTRQLCVEKPKIKYTNATLYGGLIYEMDSTQMIAQSRTYHSAEDYVASRGFVADSSMREGWSYLPATKSEVEKIARQMYEQGIRPERYTETVGTEESFKALSGRHIPIIHLATHGFFFKDEEARKRDYFQAFNLEPSRDIEDNSLKRSGLILAGGQRAWLNQPIPANVEDGILLAEEIATMDLSGTDLVVLSACQTGLGEITSEGVFGLQRAFKKAGVQTLIMSLWCVDDNATSLMMQTFYEHLLSGHSKREAFAIAQQAVKEKHPNPYYWAAFIMLD